MAIDLRERYSEQIEEVMLAQSKSKLFVDTNAGDFVDTNTVKYPIITVPSEVQKYGRANNPQDGTGKSLYGDTRNVVVRYETFTLTQDISEHMYIDRLDEKESVASAGRMLSDYIRLTLQPTIDKYRFKTLAEKAGTIVYDTNLTASNIYSAITDATEVLDEKGVPEVGRILAVTPKAYKLIKQSKDVILDEEISKEQRDRGVIAMADGMEIVRIASMYLPKGTQFFISTSDAVKSPDVYSKLEIRDAGNDGDGSFVNIRYYYDAFVLEQDKDKIYYVTYEKAPVVTP